MILNSERNGTLRKIKADIFVGLLFLWAFYVKWGAGLDLIWRFLPLVKLLFGTASRAKIFNRAF